VGYVLQFDLLIFWEVFFLGAIQIIVSIFHIIFSLSIVVVVLLQSGKSAGLSGSIAGGAETFFGKNKGRTLDALLGKYTSIAAIMFLVTSIALFLVLKYL
jgi:preprotein translocase subunit SecG